MNLLIKKLEALSTQMKDCAAAMEYHGGPSRYFRNRSIALLAGVLTIDQWIQEMKGVNIFHNDKKKYKVCHGITLPPPAIMHIQRHGVFIWPERKHSKDTFLSIKDVKEGLEDIIYIVTRLICIISILILIIVVAVMINDYLIKICSQN